MENSNNINKNIEWFDNNKSYQDFILQNQTYRNIKLALDDEIRGLEKILDIGNGGLFNYDVKLVSEIYAVDLFFDKTDKIVDGINIHFRKGSATDLPYDDNTFDAVIMVSLLHHLVGDRFDDIYNNIRKCVDECYRVLKPGGKLIVNEPVIPQWLFTFQRLLYRFIKFIICIFFKHPFAIQFTSKKLADTLSHDFKIIRIIKIKKQGMLIHFGMKVPAAISPVNAIVVVANKM